MAEIYVTLEEAAKLEEEKYKTMAQKIVRNTNNRYQIKSERSETGGKERKLVALSSLSNKAKNAYKEIQKLEELTSQPEQMEQPTEPVGEIPWYVNADLEWYIENYKEYYYKAVELCNIIRDFLHYEEKNRTKYADSYAKEHLGKEKRTLYRYTKAYLEASAWAMKKTAQDGGNYEFYKVLSLCRKPKETGLFPSIPAVQKQVIKNIWFNKEFAANQGTKEMLYDKLKAVAEINQWDKVPSYQSIARYINYLMEDEGMFNAWFLASKGSREYKNQRMVKATRDTSKLKVMQIIQGDAHTFDCWVAYRHPNGKVTPIKPKLVAWIDARSKAIMGDVICKESNTEVLKQSLLKLIYAEIGGVPEYLYIDNGKDFTAEEMTGRNRKNRSGKELDDTVLQFDDVTKGFYKSIGIQDDIRALPYEPWSKGQIERFFETVCNRFTKWMTSYTGTLTGSLTSAKIEKPIQKMFEENKLFTMDEFYALWNHWLHDVYMKKEHSSLKRLKERYKTPYDLFMNGERYFMASPPRSYVTMLMMKSESVRVNQIGIRRWGYEYRADELCNYIGTKVNIKYDPEDITVIYVYDNKGKRICEARSQELLLIAPAVSQKALEEHIKSQKRQIKRDREILAEANKPFEDLNEEYVGFSSVTGGIDLMMGKKAVKGNIIAMPRDKTYTQNKEVRKQTEQQEAQASEYMNKTAESALKKLRAMG